MAKGNLFLGTAAKSVGDVVMYRREGSQVSRVRVRKIANPKTDAQCEQRAFMSAVVKFYQPLANVLDRSWQGLSRSKSYSKFLKTNASIVRAGGYYLPKGTGFFPLPLQVSNGTLSPSMISANVDAVGLSIAKLTADVQTPTTIGELSNLLVTGDYKNGDIITIIVVTGRTSNNYSLITIQFEVDTNSSTALTSVLKGASIGSLETGNDTIDFDFADIDACGCAGIVARNVDGNWLRTTSKMTVQATIVEATTSAAAKAAAIESYKGAAASDNPLVYLDGDELENA